MIGGAEQPIYKIKKMFRDSLRTWRKWCSTSGNDFYYNYLEFAEKKLDDRIGNLI